jgi:membrane protease YdiL (CAAX protease family)
LALSKRKPFLPVGIDLALCPFVFTVLPVLSYKPWKNESVLLLISWLIMAFAGGGLLAGIIENVGSHLPRATREFLETIALNVAFQGVSFILVLCFLRKEKLSFTSAFGLKTPPIARSIIIGVVAALFVLPIVWALQEISVYVITELEYTASPQEIIRKIQSGVETPSHQIYLFVVAVLIAPIIEEILFRGILYPTVKQLGFPKLAYWGISILFAATHMNLQTFLPLLFLAMLLTLLYEETDNLIAPIAAHSCFNAINFVMLLYNDRIMDFLRTLV